MSTKQRIVGVLKVMHILKRLRISGLVWKVWLLIVRQILIKNIYVNIKCKPSYQGLDSRDKGANMSNAVVLNQHQQRTVLHLAYWLCSMETKLTIECWITDSRLIIQSIEILLILYTTYVVATLSWSTRKGREFLDKSHKS